MGVDCFHSLEFCSDNVLSEEEVLARGDVGVETEGCIYEWYIVEDEEVDEEGDNERFNIEEATTFVDELCRKMRGDKGGEGEDTCFCFCCCCCW